MIDFKVGDKVKVERYYHIVEAYVTSYSPKFDEYTLQIVGGKEEYHAGSRVRSATLSAEEFEADLKEREAQRWGESNLVVLDEYNYTQENVRLSNTLALTARE